MAAFRRAAARPRHAAEAGMLEFQALREVDISRHLVGRLLRRIGVPAAQYKGFAAVDPPLDAASVSARLGELASRAPDSGPRDLLEADRLTRRDPAPPRPRSGRAPASLELGLARAREALRRGDGGGAMAALAEAQAHATPSAAAQVALGTALWRAGEGAAAANAFNLALLYLDGTSGPGQLAFQTAYKSFRIVFCRGQFYAIPGWHDPILDIIGSETRVVIHRVPRWLRAALRRYLPPAIFGMLQRLLLRSPLRSELSLEQMVHAPDLVTVLRTVDELGPSRR